MEYPGLTHSHERPAEAGYCISAIAQRHVQGQPCMKIAATPADSVTMSEALDFGEIDWNNWVRQ